MYNYIMKAKYIEISDTLELELRQLRSAGILKLPTESEFCKRFSVSRQTVRAALDLLVNKGLIIKRHGSGYYIAEGKQNINRDILFICEDADKYIYPDLTLQLKKQLEIKKYSLTAMSTNGSLHRERDILAGAAASVPAAVMIEPIRNIVPNPNEALIGELITMGVPVISLFTRYPSVSGCICITEDDTEGASSLVRFLAGKGYKNFAGIFRTDDSRGLARYEGCIKTCAELSIPVREENYCLFTMADQRKMLQGDTSLLTEFAEKLQKDTGVICQNDMIAYELIKVLKASGSNIPDDIAITSFDNSYYSTLGDISITSLGHGDRQLSDILAKTVISAIDHKKVILEPVPWSLHIRKSTR